MNSSLRTWIVLAPILLVMAAVAFVRDLDGYVPAFLVVWWFPILAIVACLGCAAFEFSGRERSVSLLAVAVASAGYAAACAWHTSSLVIGFGSLLPVGALMVRLLQRGPADQTPSGEVDDA